MARQHPSGSGCAGVVMAFVWTLPPHLWAQVATGIWVRIDALDDPLLRADLHRVTAHRDPAGHVWVDVRGFNAGVRVQSVPPEDGYFDGGSI